MYTELDGLWADVHEAQERRNVDIVLQWVPSHKTREQATAMQLRWWHVVANQAADEAAAAFARTCQLPLGTLRRAAEVAELEKAVQERLVSIDILVIELQGKLPRKAKDERPVAATPEQRGAEAASGVAA